MLFAVYSFILGIQHDIRFLKNKTSAEIAKRHIKRLLDLHKPN